MWFMDDPLCTVVGEIIQIQAVEPELTLYFIYIIGEDNSRIICKEKSVKVFNKYIQCFGFYFKSGRLKPMISLR